MERNVNCRSVPWAELKWLVYCICAAAKKKKNLMPHLHLQNVLMRKRDFFIKSMAKLTVSSMRQLKEQNQHTPQPTRSWFLSKDEQFYPGQFSLSFFHSLYFQTNNALIIAKNKTNFIYHIQRIKVKIVYVIEPLLVRYGINLHECVLSKNNQNCVSLLGWT